MVLLHYIVFVLACFGLSLGIILTKEGCELGWTHHNNLCYQFNVHPVQYDTAKGICLTKDASLSSIWTVDEESFITHTLWQGTDKSHLSWIGIAVVPEDRIKQRINWADGSLSDYQVKAIPKSETRLCGTLTGSGKRQFWNCEESMSAFICKKPLRMAYVVSEVFNSSYDTTNIAEDPERLLFERVWPPKLQDVPKYLKQMASTQVSHETDCANRCFHVQDCRGFLLTCLLNWRCNQFTCELCKPANN